MQFIFQQKITNLRSQVPKKKLYLLEPGFLNLRFPRQSQAGGGKDMPYKYPIQRSPGDTAGTSIIII